MSEVEFYRDHINGLRQQLLLRDKLIEKLERSATASIRQRVALEQIDRDVTWLLSWLKADDQARPYLADMAASVSAVLRGES